MYVLFLRLYCDLRPYVTCTLYVVHPLQGDNTPLHLAAKEGHTTCVECLLSTPGIGVNIDDKVSWFTRCYTDACLLGIRYMYMHAINKGMWEGM